MSERTLLVVLAHPDDESFAIGGTLAKYAAEGVRVVLICATRGEAGILGMPAQAAAQVRERELRRAAATLGVAQVRFLGYPDGALALAEEEAVVSALVEAMHDLWPQVVVTFGPDGISGHPDHVAIHRLTTLAFDRACLPACLYYIAPSEATLQGCGVAPPEAMAGMPVVGIDVSAHLVAQVRAMQRHASQIPPFPGPPEVEATRLACHEYFTLARPTDREGDETDLFCVAPKEIAWQC